MLVLIKSFKISNKKLDKNKNRIKKILFARRWLIPKPFFDFYKTLKLINWVKNGLLNPFKTPTFVKQKYY